MPRFVVHGKLTIDVATVVDASNEIEAECLAAERGCLCVQRGNNSEEWVASESLDWDIEFKCVELASPLATEPMDDDDQNEDN